MHLRLSPWPCIQSNQCLYCIILWSMNMKNSYGSKGNSPMVIEERIQVVFRRKLQSVCKNNRKWRDDQPIELMNKDYTLCPNSYPGNFLQIFFATLVPECWRDWHTRARHTITESARYLRYNLWVVSIICVQYVHWTHLTLVNADHYIKDTQEEIQHHWL